MEAGAAGSAFAGGVEVDFGAAGVAVDVDFGCDFGSALALAAGAGAMAGSALACSGDLAPDCFIALCIGSPRSMASTISVSFCWSSLVF